MGLLEPDGRPRRGDGEAALARRGRQVRGFRTLDDIGDVAGKRVLVREDLNVPMDGARVTDDTRLRAAAPTVAELADRGAIVLILAHFDRPKGKHVASMSLAPVTRPLSEVLGRDVRFIDDCCG